MQYVTEALLPLLAMEDLSEVDRIALINAIAGREGTAKEISKWYAIEIEDLREFVSVNITDIERAKELIERSKADRLQPSELTVGDLDSLWVTQKAQRLARYQIIADLLYGDITTGNLAGAELATATREFRSYLGMVANELGQLLHRGAGDGGTGDTVSYDIRGVDIDSLR